MDGIHDLGGKHGYGQVIREIDEPVFHARWEAKVFAMMMACFEIGAYRNADQFRHSIERIDPVAYLSHGYYGRWLGGLETALIEAGFVSQAEIGKKVAELGGNDHALIAARPEKIPGPPGEKSKQRGSKRSVAAPLYKVGLSVLTSREVKPGHTRLPAYARGKIGTIILHHDGWVFPDTNAHGKGESPQHLYTVQFTALELWGSDNPVKVSLDLFEPYLSEVS